MVYETQTELAAEVKEWAVETAEHARVRGVEASALAFVEAMGNLIPSGDSGLGLG